MKSPTQFSVNGSKVSVAKSGGTRCIVMGSEAGSEASKEATSANPTAARTEDGGTGENKSTGGRSPVTLTGVLIASGIIASCNVLIID